MTGGTQPARRPGPRAMRVLFLVAGLALLGATAFGLWHLVVGGFVNGNPRAATFGVVLALVAGLPLFAGIRLARRRRSIRA